MKSLRLFLLLLGPLLFLVSLVYVPAEMNPEVFRVLAMGAWMITWWVTEIVPIPVTALLPLVVLPYIGVFSISESAAPYANPIIFLFMGGFIIALALEKHKLHLRLALNILRLTGTSGNGIILGFMISTALLSMWISNTATAVMMLPVALSVIELLKNSDSENKSMEMFATGLMLSIAYAANIGGTMTIIGTPPNIVLAGYSRELLNYDIPFAQWMLVGMTVGTILLLIVYLLLVKLLYANKLYSVDNSAEMITERLQELGPLNQTEKKVITVFALTAIAWIFRGNINSLIGFNLLSDATTAMTGGLLMFIVPEDFSNRRFLLSWDDMQKLPWGILILFGGGMCLAKGLESVGIIQQVGELVMGMELREIFLIIFIVTIIVLFLTELMSNVALVTIFIPVAIGIANGLGLDPFMLIIPATLASSCAFMMPISTPPNAVVFASGHIRMHQMMRAGWILNVISAMVISLICYFLVQNVF